MSGKILAVDDDALNLKLVAATLGREGYQVITASNGKEGVRKAEEELPDLIILDVMMPEMDGYQACGFIRKNPKTANTPIMMLTSLGSVEEKIRGFDAGADDYLAKPFAPDELLAHVKVLLRRVVGTSEKEGAANGKIIAVFSLRGGVGVSTMAANLAAGLSLIWGEPAVLVDLVFASGQSALMFNLPYRRTWANFSQMQTEEIDSLVVNDVLLQHQSGTRILAASPRPEQNEALTAEKVTQVIGILSQQYQYLVLDLPHDFRDITLAGLDSAHEILLLLSPDLAAVRAAVCALSVFDDLKYPREMIRLVLNWTFQKGGLPKKDIENALNRTIDLQLPFTPEPIVQAINVGSPPVFSSPQSPLGSFFEDLSFLISKDSHKKVKPKNPSEAWLRVIHRIQHRQTKV